VKKFVKIVAAILPLAVALTACVSCKKSTDPADTETKTVSRTQGIDFDEELGNVADYSVLISGEATATETYAADQLVKYVQEVTGETIEYVTDKRFSDEKIISVGRTNFFETSGVEANETELGADGFIIKNKSASLLICGGDDRGTLYGV